jgi:hypothetical protein
VGEKPWTGLVDSLAVHNGNLLVGGRSGGMARWDGKSWHEMAEGPDGDIEVMAAYQGELVVGGDFFTIGSAHVSAHWARWGRSGILGDGDNDGRVELFDFSNWVLCRTAPFVPESRAATTRDCLCLFNTDGDADIDLLDFSALQIAFGK